ncbi:MAG: hypothetical protein WEA75_01490 [Acidimicrobiia bacterium]
MLWAATTSLSDGFSIPLLVAGTAVAAGWVAAATVIALARQPPRIRASAASMELPPESPPVAGLLVNDFVLPAETAPAILLDLAARRVVELDEVQPGRTICRLRRSSDEPLAKYEQRVLESLREKAVDGVVPADALTTGPEAKSKSWHRELAKEVVGETKASGLTHDRWPRAAVIALGALLAVAVLLLALSLKEDTRSAPDEVPVLILGVIAAGIAFIAIAVLIVGRMGSSLAQLPTEAGRVAAARAEGLERHLREDELLADLAPAAVKIRGRHFAYAAAFGAAPLAVELLPMGTEDDHRAWSRFGGRWRRVRVRYPRVWPPVWGMHPAFALFVAIFWGGLAGLAIRGLVALADADRPIDVSSDDWRWVERGALLAMIPFVLILAWALVVFVRAGADLPSTREITGDVVRDRVFEKWSSSNDSPKYRRFLAIDDGTSDRIVAFRLRQSRLWAGHTQGDTLTVDVSPRLGYVRSFTKEPGPERPGAEGAESGG